MNFYAYDVDSDTCVMADASPAKWTMEDVDFDGDSDMLLHFRTQDLNLSSDSTEATFTGYTEYGVGIEGTDSVKIVSTGKNN